MGPIGILCIKRSLVNGRLNGLISGLGAASADAVYGCIAGFGLTFVSSFLVSQQLLLSLVGGAFLVYLGVRSFFSTVVEDQTQPGQQSLYRAYGSTFFLTLTNPMTILSFAAVFAGLGLANTGGDYGAALLLVFGVFLGSSLWWTLLSGGVGLFRKRFKTQHLQWVNRISGIVLTVFGVIAIASNLLNRF